MQKKPKDGAERNEAKCLKLSKETLQRLTEPQLTQVGGGGTETVCGATRNCCH